jgi:transcriptional regulator
MYIRAIHAEPDPRVLRQLIRDNPLGLLTTGIQSATYPFLQSSHIPFVLDVEDDSSETELGRLRGHIARQNPQSKAMIETLTTKPQPNNVLEHEVLIIFTSPAQHYVPARFYVETVSTDGKAVPTWNYAAVQAYGKARIFFDAAAEETVAYLTKQMSDLSHQSETKIMGHTGGDRPAAWKLTDAPERYIELLTKGILGIEVVVDRLEGKVKMSQESNEADRAGVIEGFASIDSDVTQAIAQMVKDRGEAKAKAK